ncbi:hypothetical protein [Xanthomarina gelatinilytica]|uniref:hypothetical protein n=1 Tax=Xanthomarina gelatinilytica TaxID=1137281 RepID=UPI003AA9BD0A
MTSFETLKTNSYYLLVQDLDINEVSEPFNFTNFIIYFVLGLSVLINIVLLFIKKNNRRHKSTSSGSKRDHDAWYNTLERNNNQLKNENRNLKSKIFELEKKLAVKKEERKDFPVENRIQPTISSPVIEQQFVDEKPRTVEFEVMKPTVIYLPSPFEDNRFSTEDVSNEQMPTSLYQIILDASNTTGKLLIIENADFTRALNSPDHYLEKACIYENAFSPNANGINIVEPGKVKLENQDWLIIQKIKIKFI